MRRDPPLAKVLPKLPGTKEARYAHLLSGDVEVPELPHLAASPVSSRASVDTDRIDHLENELAALRKELTDLKQQFSDFQRQFQ
jgi:uncharacterized protein YceH (UPF0502 family)